LWFESNAESPRFVFLGDVGAPYASKGALANTTTTFKFDVSEFMGALSTQVVSVARTASTLPDRVVSNREIGELLVAGVLIDDEAAADIVAKTRERSELIERKTGLRARRFFAPEESPVDVGVELMERLVPEGAWATLDALIVSSSSAQGFPGLSQQILAATRHKHSELGAPFVLDVGSNACTSFMYGHDRRERHEDPWLSPCRVLSN
jgi:hypothetical protein